jgi:AcrR family transcriptional regulator
MHPKHEAALSQIKDQDQARTGNSRRQGEYHHGALREALLSAAEALLLERGVEAFSLRECARRAGVSHGAPAHHFGDARGLLTAFATAGFERMALRMQHYAQEAGDDPEQRLAAVGRAYVDFALDHPAHFRLMFRSDRLDPDDMALKQAGASAAQALAWSLSVALEHRGVDTQTLQERCLLAWSAVHGLAMLVLDADLSAFGVSHDSVGSARKAAAGLLNRLGVSLMAP